MQVTFRPDGTAEWVGTGAKAAKLVAGAEQAKQRRASHVEPCSRLLRIAFHALRAFEAWMQEEHETTAEPLTYWTRRWGCKWRVRVVGGPTWGSYTDRAEAIRDEIAWLEEHAL